MADNDPQWLEKLQSGDEQAAQRLWEEYFLKIQRLADKKLGSRSRRAADEEDIAISAMHSIVRGARKGRFPQLNDETDLWKVIVTVTKRKLSKFARRENAQIRKPRHGIVHGESMLDPPDSSQAAGMGQIAGDDPTPEFIVEMDERCQSLLDELEEPELREVAVLKLQGYQNEEIAEKLNRTCRTVERRLVQVRQRWEKHLQPKASDGCE